MTINELSKKLKMKPMTIRSRLRRHMPHTKGKRWEIAPKQVSKVIKLLKE